MITIGLKRVQTVALWTMAQAALISQAEFFQIINEKGPSALLALCAEKGLLKPSKPARSEMKFEHMLPQKYQTSNPLFFTDSRNGPVEVDIKNWRLSIEGDGVDRPFSLNYDELLKLPVTTVTRYLECAENSRKAEGERRHMGKWGIAEWTGVRLSEVLKISGLKKKALEVMPVGLDSPSCERPLPLSKAMEEDTLLAYIMNGEILPSDHGFPLRTIVSGWSGASSTKWVTKIIVSTKPVHAAANTDISSGPGYSKKRPEECPAGIDRSVGSACCLPWPAILKAGHQDITGYAWSPFGKIISVEVSLDRGKTFQPAQLTGPNIEKAGTRWEFCFHAEPGRFTITPRATDDQGNTECIDSQKDMEREGCSSSAAVPHPVTVPETGGEIYSTCVDMETVTTSGCC